ncbi:MAG: peptidoglycan DD-metalloendopeptidase family protein [Patescibacteria group bacterium]|nr:peptidoglycan DD-metalloendopeptidase family protein [Patescibacteria group bacterium]
MSISKEITRAIAEDQGISPLIPQAYLRTPPLRFDFSKQNPNIRHVNMADANTLQAYINESLTKAGRTWGMGGYGEERFFYEKSSLFKSGDEYRSIHIGLDIWLPAGTALCAPLNATVHSFRLNDNFLDYGPTIVLQHDIRGVIFHTLYGHLSKQSLEGLREGEKIASGEHIATLGNVQENGSWPPHLHWQVIGEMRGKKGDYPGVVTPSEKEVYLSVCPDPETLLRPFLPDSQ